MIILSPKLPTRERETMPFASSRTPRTTICADTGRNHSIHLSVTVIKIRNKMTQPQMMAMVDTAFRRACCRVSGG